MGSNPAALAGRPRRRDTPTLPARDCSIPRPSTASDAGAPRFIKRSERRNPRVSLILLDWSVRESFHLLHYLSLQDVPREWFEVIVVEYYSRVSDAVRSFEDQVDTWLLLGMPEDCYYHKHLMYNAGIFVANGDICVICDSDAMVRPGFIRAITSSFEQDPDIVLHIDQFRNARRDLYPFCYPDFDEVTGRGCINYAGGVTRGLVDDRDTIHSRNYGACMCARREHLVAIGGADEHADYLGHVCGPYDMTFRLVNKGLTEVWHRSEFTYHTWHPGQAGENNYLGPHDGRHVSTTALESLRQRRVLPLVENATIRALRQGHRTTSMDTFEISARTVATWIGSLNGEGPGEASGMSTRRLWNGFVIEHTADGVTAHPIITEDAMFAQRQSDVQFRGSTEAEIQQAILASLPRRLRVALPLISALTYASRACGTALMFARRRISRWLRHGASQ